MRVIIKGQSVVTDILRGVLRLAHRADGQGFDHVGFRGVLHLIEHLVQAAGDGGLAVEADLMTELAHKSAQILKLRRVRIVVDTINEGLARGLSALGFSNKLGNRPVGEQHEFLNQMVGVAADLEVHAGGLVLLIKLEFDFLLIEAECAFAHTSGTQLLRHTVEGPDGVVEICFLSFRVVVLNDLLRLFIGKSAVAVNGCSAKPTVVYGPILVHLKDGAEGVFIFVRAEGTDPVGQYFGKHRNYSVH